METPSTLLPRFGLVLTVVVCAAAFSRDSGPQNPQAYVDLHNAIRAAVQKPPGYPGTWAPIPPVAWSDEVASSAQQWADHLRDDRECKLEHSDTQYGENLAGGKDVDVDAAVDMWAKEKAHYAWSPQYEFEIPTGHYTQVVWRKTAFIGCGRATCGRRVVIVCRYSPAGNHIGKAPY